MHTAPLAGRRDTLEGCLGLGLLSANHEHLTNLNVVTA
jgi:hypothetical protein